MVYDYVDKMLTRRYIYSSTSTKRPSLANAPASTVTLTPCSPWASPMSPTSSPSSSTAPAARTSTTPNPRATPPSTAPTSAPPSTTSSSRSTPPSSPPKVSSGTSPASTASRCTPPLRWCGGRTSRETTCGGGCASWRLNLASERSKWMTMRKRRRTMSSLKE